MLMPDALPGQNGQRRWLEYLPAIFQQQHKLDQFLTPFETQFALFEEILAEIDRNFAVSFAPSDDFLPWLAQWVAHSFDEGWNEDKRRRFLAQAMDLYRWRGTVRGLKRYLELWLDLRPEGVSILEHRWPGGMQIGVASRIGHVVNGGADKTGRTVAQNPVVDLVSHDYYVVDTVTPTDLPAGIDGQSIPDGERIQLYYDAAFVQRIVLQPDGVLLDYFERNTTGEGRTLREFSHRRPPDDSRVARRGRGSLCMTRATAAPPWKPHLGRPHRIDPLRTREEMDYESAEMAADHRGRRRGAGDCRAAHHPAVR
jgi:phage tail-like protein